MAALKDGRGLKPSARAAGVGKETGRRWVRESFTALRDQGLSVDQAKVELGFASSLMAGWDARNAEAPSGARHHLQRGVDVEVAFWSAWEVGVSLGTAARAAGVGRSTAYRWWQQRFVTLRGQGVSVRSAAHQLRVPAERAAAWERQQRESFEAARAREQAAQRAAMRSSRAHGEALMARRARPKALTREERYWALMRAGMSNTQACMILGVHRKTGVNIRKRTKHQTAAQAKQDRCAGRYLSLPERLVIADLLRLGTSMRAIADELGRAPSTIKRELDRHRDGAGRYLPHRADQTAEEQRRRPRQPRLLIDVRLRRLVQRKLNRCWSPQQIAGWLRATHADESSRWVCTETIYRALLVPGGRGLHKRYCGKLRTGRRIRKSRWLTRAGHGGAVRNMTMIDQRPPEVEARIEAGHWEGDLIIGLGSASAMITLRERVTHYGVIVNLPLDHTAAAVNAALVKVFAALPPTLAKTLTWDPGTEMARHLDFTAASGVTVYFAERSSPWQRGANENFNGLARQYFPKNTDLSLHTHQHVTAVTHELNTRPRKTLGYLTPTVRFRAAHRSPSQPRESPQTTRTLAGGPALR